MPFAVFKALTRESGDIEYRENGVQFIVDFKGVHGEVGQCEILDGESEPISGDNVQTTVGIKSSYGIDRNWDVIPYEFLQADILRN